jgi:uncharacterized protein YndB with AHSA1/START domain
MPNAAAGAVVRKNVRVQASIARAFSVFVEQMETWWPAHHHIGAQPFQCIVVEPRAGGRWYEQDTQRVQCQWGTVLAWDPPHKVSLSWHLGPDWKFNPDLSFASEIEIRFTSDGSFTLVELEHRGLERNGEGFEQLRAMLDSPDAWTATLAAFANAIANPNLHEEGTR